MSSTEVPVCAPGTLLHELPLVEVASPTRVWKLPFASIELPEYQGWTPLPPGSRWGDLGFEKSTLVPVPPWLGAMEPIVQLTPSDDAALITFVWKAPRVISPPVSTIRYVEPSF